MSFDVYSQFSPLFTALEPYHAYDIHFVGRLLEISGTITYPFFLAGQGRRGGVIGKRGVVAEP